MNAVAQVLVTADDDGIRLDRWFKRHYPLLAHGHLQKLLRGGDVRIDGRRAKAGDRIAAGQSVRVPPLGAPHPVTAPAKKAPAAGQDPGRLRDLLERVLYRDDQIIALNKPPGLAVQGGRGVAAHIDGMLDGLRFGHDQRPRLVHRLDRDTSGVLLLGRTAAAAAALAKAFRSREARKLYWALLAGVPDAEEGVIRLALAKVGPKGGLKGGPKGGLERVRAGPGGKAAETHYRIIDRAGRRAAWAAFEPLTGRTHQLRVHAADGLGIAIAGDGKYGGRAAFLEGGIEKRLHLHARGLRIPRPGGGILEVTAPLPRHMAEAWTLLGFNADDAAAGFIDRA